MAVKTFKIKAPVRWCKVLGKAPPGFDNGPAEWSFELLPDKQALEDYKASGADKFYIKKDKKTGEDFIKFVRKAQKKDGTDSKPITVLGPDGKTEWDQNKKIGNGSVLVAKFALNEVNSQGKKRLKPSILAVQVWEHVPYDDRNQEFEANPESSNILDQSGDEW